MLPSTMAPPMPRPDMNAMSALMGGGAGGMPGNLDPSSMMAILGAMQPPDPNIPNAQTTFPEVPRAMNPAFSQMVLQALMGASQQPQMSNLGALLAGR